MGDLVILREGRDDRVVYVPTFPIERLKFSGSLKTVTKEDLIVLLDGYDDRGTGFWTFPIERLDGSGSLKTGTMVVLFE